MLELLAVLSASAAAGMRVALPLLLIGLLYGGSLWSQVPILSGIDPHVVLGVLVSWSLVEIFASKNRAGQRLLSGIQLMFSPIVGAIMGVAVVRATVTLESLVWLLGITGGLLACVLQLVQTGWFYRMKRIPLWVIFAQDVLCVALVFSAFRAPQQGGLVALLLLWLSIRTSKEWHSWYSTQAESKSRSNPRLYKRDPD
ncbi:MAG: DUF4126 domain-containing protein [Leptolyngbyaceae cyanobacterium RU_5_1]|nr:DUF4126 domain-containing protein [Leptolyngbyaceae cyanobacterium RU_5_1]